MMQTMSKEDVEQWCKENNHTIINLSVQRIPADVVLKIAESAVDIDDITRKTKEEEYVLAKFMAIDYLARYLPKKKIAKLLHIDRTNVYNGESTKILTKGENYLKGWQKFAINIFNSKIKEIENEMDSSKK